MQTLFRTHRNKSIKKRIRAMVAACISMLLLFGVVGPGISAMVDGGINPFAPLLALADNSDMNDTLESANTYLVEIDVSNSTKAYTGDTASVSFRYMDYTGETHTTETYDIRSSAVSFWMSVFKSANIEADFNEMDVAIGANYNLKWGNSAYFFITADQVEKFTAATFSVNGNDDFQVERFAIYDASQFIENHEAGVKTAKNLNREAAAILHMTNSLNIMQATFDGQWFSCENRLENSKYCVAVINALENYDPNKSEEDVSAGFYIQKDHDRTINFYGKSIVTRDSWDRSDNQYEMSYDMAASGLNFTDKYYKYKVTVNVAGDVDKNDDSGSANYFYFQLEFMNKHKSAYVQANQQLQGDSFKSGLPATFYIHTNQDYGDLKAIRIVPENSSDNGGDPYDKLNIKSIDVTNTNDQGVVSTWTFSKIGWVGIDSADSVNTQTHLESEIAKVCTVDSRDNSVNLQFSITNGMGCKSSDPYNGTGGPALAKIYYIKDSTGLEASTDYLDIVKLSNDFNNKEDGSFDSVLNGYSADGSFYKGGVTNRFLYSIKDIRKLTKIEIKSRALEDKVWEIGNVGVSLLQSGDSNSKTISMSGEYIIEDAMFLDVASLDLQKCTEKERTIRFGSGSEVGATEGTILYFNSEIENLSKLVAESTTLYTITKEPEAGIDLFNVIAICADNEDYSKYTLKTTINYKNSMGNIVCSEADIKHTETMNGHSVFTYEGFPINDFTALDARNAVSLSASGGSSLRIQSVLLQHVRGEVVLNTYKCSFGIGANACLGISSGAATVLDNEDEHQVVYVELGEQTQETNGLVSQNYDLAVSLDYVDTFMTNKVYRTTNSFLTEYGVNSVGPGKVVKFETNYNNVDVINGIHFSATGNLQVEIRRYAVATYKKVDGKDVCTGWYSFDASKVGTVIIKNATVGTIVQSKQVSSPDTVNLLKFTFKTKDRSAVFNDTGINSAVAMQINYTDYQGDGSTRSMLIPDINDYLVKGSFSAGDTAEVQILVTGITSSNIESIDLLPYDRNVSGKITVYDPDLMENTGIIWGLDQMMIEFGDGDANSATNGNYGKLSMTVDEVVESGTGVSIDVKDVYIRALVSYKEYEDAQIIKKDPVFNGDLEIKLPYNPDGVDIDVDLKINNSNKGWTTEIKDLTPLGKLTYVSANENNISTTPITEDKITITMEGDVNNTTSKEIVFTANANKSRKVTLTVIMLSYEETYGTKPLTLDVISDSGENCTVNTEEPGKITVPGNRDALIRVNYYADSSSAVALDVKQIAGSPLTYVVTDLRDGTATIELNGNRSAGDCVLEVVATSRNNGETKTVSAQITVTRDANASGSVGSESMTFSYKKHNGIVYGVINGEDKNVKLYVPAEENVSISYSTSNGTILIDDTKYEDIIETEEATETEVTPVPETTQKEITESETEMEQETETKEEIETSIDYEEESSQSDTKEEATEVEETAMEETVPATKNGARSIRMTKKHDILDPNRAILDHNTIILPSSQKSYVFIFKGRIEIIHQ